MAEVKKVEAFYVFQNIFSQSIKATFSIKVDNIFFDRA